MMLSLSLVKLRNGGIGSYSDIATGIATLKPALIAAIALVTALALSGFTLWVMS